MMNVCVMPLYGLSSDANRIEWSFKFFHSYDIYLKLFHIICDENSIVPFMGQGLSAPIIDQMITSLSEQSTQSSNNVQTLFKDFKNQCEKSSPYVDKTSLHILKGHITEVLPHFSFFSDLILFPFAQQELSHSTFHSTLESAILDSARPVLMTPLENKKYAFKKICLFWNNTPQSARALKEAFIFLKKETRLIIIHKDEMEDLPETHNLLKNYLHHHDIKTTFEKIECKEDEIGQALINYTKKNEMDLLIMGAYSYSKLRQLVLGSVTKHVIDHMICSTLFIH